MLFRSERLVELNSTNPARIFGLDRKGAVSVGMDADLVILDPEGRGVRSAKSHFSRADRSIFEGHDVKGRIERTIVGGKVVFEGGVLMTERGAGRVDPPEQLVEREGRGYRLVFRPRQPTEAQNAALSASTNIAVAHAMQAAHTGLFRVMPEPDQRAVARLRHTAHAFDMRWPKHQTLDEYARTLDPNDPRHAAFMLAVRRAAGGASYATYADGVTPWHSALAATYAHSTAPLRRLADRYVVECALAVANGREVPEAVQAALPRLPDTMAAASSQSSKVDRAVVDLAEAVLLQGHEGHTFRAVVVEDEGDVSRIQLVDIAVVAKLRAANLRPGDECRVKLVRTDPARREVEFTRVA